MDDVKLTVRMESYVIQLPLDEDGTPTYMGERLVEVEPGLWMHPDGIALQGFLKRDN
jgi:hypothetical protein